MENKEQSIGFIVGYLFSRVEASIFKHIFKLHSSNYSGYELIPKCWFGLRPVKSATVDITGEHKFNIRKQVEEIFSNFLPSCNVTIDKIIPDKQYIRFEYTAIDVTKAKKVDKLEIEAGKKSYRELQLNFLEELGMVSKDDPLTDKEKAIARSIHELYFKLMKAEEINNIQ